MPVLPKFTALDRLSVAAIPGCWVVVPNFMGNMPIYVADAGFCNEYTTLNQTFCALPSTYQDLFQHTCSPTITTATAAAGPPAPVDPGPNRGGTHDDEGSSTDEDFLKALPLLVVFMAAFLILSCMNFECSSRKGYTSIGDGYYMAS
ncbi:hypothetical protein F5Y11DRAFT_362536 [Daldinia sp. FL1419]|nr:hypothetical protein F5Y11DRAFT_362536 [Daldinia sp. FL1419]